MGLATETAQIPSSIDVVVSTTPHANKTYIPKGISLEEARPILTMFANWIFRGQYPTEDVVQKAYVKILQAKPEKLTRAYLRKVIQNLFIDYQRVKKFPQTLGDDLEAHLPLERSVEDIVMEHHFHPKIGGVLRQMPKQYSLTVFLIDVEGYKYKQVAEMMHVSIGTVTSRIYRGREYIRQHLKLEELVYV